MHNIFDPRRPTGRFFYLLISIAVALGVSRAQAPQLTTINDTVYRANGQPASGSIVLTWPAFTTADNKPVAAGELTVPIAASGALAVQLAPNQNSVPAGSYYKAVYKLSDGTTATEYWSVPAASPTTIGAIRSQIVPASVAAQLVTRQYVDNVLFGAASDLVHKSGAETVTGPKTFSSTITSSVSSGTAPLIVASNTKVGNLNVDLLDGADWASPSAIGSARLRAPVTSARFRSPVPRSTSRT